MYRGYGKIELGFRKGLILHCHVHLCWGLYALNASPMFPNLLYFILAGLLWPCAVCDIRCGGGTRVGEGYLPYKFCLNQIICQVWGETGLPRMQPQTWWDRHLAYTRTGVREGPVHHLLGRAENDLWTPKGQTLVPHGYLSPLPLFLLLMLVARNGPSLLRLCKPNNNFKTYLCYVRQYTWNAMYYPTHARCCP